MQIYDTLLIGCSYASLGYALARGNCLITEEHQACDTHFYLPLKGYSYMEYAPKTEEGARLLKHFNELSLFRDGMQNTNGFECALCQYVDEIKPSLLLNCRVIRTAEENGVKKITVQTNEGLTTVYAKQILDTRAHGEKKRATVLFGSKNIENDAPILMQAFPEAKIEQAFYENRYALTFEVNGYDENEVKIFVSEQWRAAAIEAKIIYIAPVFSTVGNFDALCDSRYANPIEAFEVGYFAGKESLK